MFRFFSECFWEYVLTSSFFTWRRLHLRFAISTACYVFYQPGCVPLNPNNIRLWCLYVVAVYPMKSQQNLQILMSPIMNKSMLNPVFNTYPIQPPEQIPWICLYIYIHINVPFNSMKIHEHIPFNLNPRYRKYISHSIL